MELTQEFLTNNVTVSSEDAKAMKADARPFLTYYENEDGELSYNFNLSTMEDKTHIDLRLTSDPSAWEDRGSGAYGPSYLAFFETLDGVPVTAFIQPSRKCKGSKDNNLYSEFQKYSDGDEIRLGLDVKPIKKTNKSWKRFYVQPLGDTPASDFPTGSNQKATTPAPTPTVVANGLMPRVKLSEGHVAVIQACVDAGLSADEVRETLGLDNEVPGVGKVSFTAQAIEAILASPADYGLDF